jgi:hypothetical protein
MPTVGQLVQQKLKARAADRAQPAAEASTAAGGKAAGRAQPAAGASTAAGGKAAGRAQPAAEASKAAGSKDKVICLSCGNKLSIYNNVECAGYDKPAHTVHRGCFDREEDTFCKKCVDDRTKAEGKGKGKGKGG